MKLNKAGVINMMELTDKGMRENNGDAAGVSKVVWPLIAAVPEELVARVQNADGSGAARLTKEGAIVLKWHREFASRPKHNQP